MKALMDGSLVLRPMTQVDCIFTEYKTEVIVDDSFETMGGSK